MILLIAITAGWLAVNCAALLALPSVLLCIAAAAIFAIESSRR